MKLTNENINFDSPFIVLPNGEFERARSIYGPSAYHDEDCDIYLDSSGWTALTGYTGQHGYNGAVLHSSEYLGGGLLKDILDDVGGVYCLTVVEDMEDPDNPVGWCVLQYVG